MISVKEEMSAEAKWQMFVRILQEEIDKRIKQPSQDPAMIMEIRNPLIGLTLSPEIRAGGTENQQKLATIVLEVLRATGIRHQFSKEQLIALRICADFMIRDLSPDIIMALINLLITVGLSLPLPDTPI